jgi:hypothetical protein
MIFNFWASFHAHNNTCKNQFYSILVLATPKSQDSQDGQLSLPKMTRALHWRNASLGFVVVVLLFFWLCWLCLPRQGYCV